MASLGMEMFYVHRLIKVGKDLYHHQSNLAAFPSLPPPCIQHRPLLSSAGSSPCFPVSFSFQLLLHTLVLPAGSPKGRPVLLLPTLPWIPSRGFLWLQHSACLDPSTAILQRSSSCTQLSRNHLLPSQRFKPQNPDPPRSFFCQFISLKRSSDLRKKSLILLPCSSLSVV